jgi:hypothetical protein
VTSGSTGSESCSVTFNAPTNGPYSGNIVANSLTDSSSLTPNSVIATFTIFNTLVANPITSNSAAPYSAPGATSVDSGNAIILTANPSGGSGYANYTYSWSDGSSSSCSSSISGNSNTLIENPTSNTFYCYTVSDSATGQSATYKSLEITINPPITVASISVTPKVDTGQNVGLYFSGVTGGSPGSNGIYRSYEWCYSLASGTMCNGNVSNFFPTNSISNTMITTTPTLPGNYNYGLFISDYGGYSYVSANQPVEVSNALATAPTPTVQNDSIDQGQSVTLVTDVLPSNLGGTNPVTYTWLVSTNNSGAYSPANSLQCAAPSGTANAGNTVVCSSPSSIPTGTYTYKLELTDSATTQESTTSSSSNSITVSQAPTVTITNPSLIEDVGQSVTFTTSNTPGSGTDTYQWYNTTGNTPQLISGANSPYLVINAINANSKTGSFTYNVVITDSNKGTGTSTASLTVNSVPTINQLSPITIDGGQVPVYTASVNGGTGSFTYFWTLGNGLTPYSSYCQQSNAVCQMTATNTGNSPITSYVTLSANDIGTSPGAIPPANTQIDTATVTINPELTYSATVPMVSNSILDLGQTETITANAPTTGTSPYTYYLESSSDGSSYSSVNNAKCVSSASGATCTYIPANTGSRYYEVKVIDNAPGAHENALSSNSVLVTVNSALPSTSSAPTVTSPHDANQIFSISAILPDGGTPELNYYFTYSTVSGSGQFCPIEGEGYKNNEHQGFPGNTIQCSNNNLSYGYPGTYTITMQYSDSASTPESGSSASTTFVVYPTLTPASTPVVSANALDSDQSLTVTSNLPTTGAPPYSYQWLVSVNNEGFTDSTYCETNTNTSASPGATESCAIKSNTLTPGDTYSFKLQVSDSAVPSETTTSSPSNEITVDTPLTYSVTPTVSNSILDLGQTETITAPVADTGTSPYTYSLFGSSNGTEYSKVSNSICDVPSSSVNVYCTYIPANTGSHYYEVKVTDSASTPEILSSNTVEVTVNPALSFNSVIPLSQHSVLDLGQNEEIVIPYPLTGTTPYTYNLLESSSLNGTYSLTLNSSCSTPVLRCIYTPANMGPHYYKVLVTDSASTPENSLTSNSIDVTVNPALSVSASPEYAIEPENYSMEIIANVHNGTSPYTYNWFVDGNTISLGTNNSFIYNWTRLQNDGIITIPSNVVPSSTVDNVTLSVTDGAGASLSFNALISHQSSMSVSNVLIPSNSALEFDINNATLDIVSNSSNSITGNVLMSNVTSNITSTPTQTNRGFSKLMILDINVSSSENGYLTKTVTFVYGGGLNASAITPYILSGSTWIAVTPYTVNTITNTVKFNIPGDPIIGIFQSSYVPPSTSNGYSGSMGGTGGGSGGVVSGGGGPITTVTKINTTTENGWSISNFSQDSSENVNINGTQFNVVENYMTSNPDTAGITVNGHSYNLQQGTPVNLQGNYYVELKSVSWIPILHSVTVDIYGEITPAVPSNTTTTQTPKTTITTSVSTIPTTTVAPVTTIANTTTKLTAPPASATPYIIGVIVVIAILVTIAAYTYKRQMVKSYRTKQKKHN